MVRKSLLALLCAVGITVTPRVESVAAELVTIGAVYEFISLFRTWTRYPKPDRKKRPFWVEDTSMKLFQKNPTQWRKNIWKNLVIFQEDYSEGQGFRDTYLKVKRGEFIKASKAKCYPFGFNGHLLSYLAFLGKTQKSMKDLALLAFAVVRLNGGIPKSLSGNERFAKLFKYFGWENPYGGGGNNNNRNRNEFTLTVDQWRTLPDYTREEILTAIANNP